MSRQVTIAVAIAIGLLVIKGVVTEIGKPQYQESKNQSTEIKPAIAEGSVVLLSDHLRQNYSHYFTELKQYKKTELLYLSVNADWFTLSQAEQLNLAVELRDYWKSVCECFAPQIIFTTTQGVELVKISAGQPVVIQ